MTRFAIIAGTGFETLDELVITDQHKQSTAWGAPSAPIRAGELRGEQVLFLSRHGLEHQFAPHEVNYRANIAALKEAGAEAILAVYTVGGITAANQVPGTLAIPDQIIDYTWGRPQSYSMTGEVIHVDFTEPFDAALRARLLAAARAEVAAEGEEGGAPVPIVDGGVYGATQGPRLESAAEVNRMERDGCDLVGMTGMPEVGLACELGLPIAGICLVVNPAAGRGGISMEEIHAVAAAGRSRILKVLARAVAGA
ncbi:MAG TPA: S-methyl-5'-thioinosine phosphorylase [Pseudomonadales bacterium]|nr:S-methyl-5'-thioinosine phosphorylase [Pseudomonadales bacterium]